MNGEPQAGILDISDPLFSPFSFSLCNYSAPVTYLIIVTDIYFLS
jgi:hypothetical protein